MKPTTSVSVLLTISMLIVTACAPAQASQSAQPTEFIDLTSDPGGLLTPDVSLTSTHPATLPPSSPTASLTPASTEESSPTAGIAYSACDAMSRPQAESILGTLSGDPFVLEYIGPGPELVGLCVFPGSLNTASVEVYQFKEAANARAQFERHTGGEAIVGVGDAAQWDESGLVLAVVRGTVTLYITMTLPEGARDQAIQIGQIAAVRIP